MVSDAVRPDRSPSGGGPSDTGATPATPDAPATDQGARAGVVLATIAARRSTSRLVEPAPRGADLDALLAAAACAPDHGELRPFEFVVLDGDAKDAFGAVLEAAYRARCAEAGNAVEEARAAKERTKLGRAPLVVVVIARHRPSATIPGVEQYAAAAAATQNLLVAATALGYGSMWRTGEPTYDPRVHAALGLGERDAVVGWIYLGSHPAGATPKPPRQPDLTGLVRDWQP